MASDSLPAQNIDIPMRIIGADDFYLSMDGALNRVAYALKNPTTQRIDRVSATAQYTEDEDILALSPIIFRPSDFDSKEKMLAKINAAENQISAISALSANRFAFQTELERNQMIRRIESGLMNAIENARENVESIMYSGKLLCAQPVVKPVTDEELSAFEAGLVNNEQLMPNYMKAGLSRKLVNFIAAHDLSAVLSDEVNREHGGPFNVFYTDHKTNMACADVGIATLKANPEALAEFIYDTAGRFIGYQEKIIIHNAQLQNDIQGECSSPKAAAILAKEHYPSGRETLTVLNIMSAIHYWINDPRSGVSLEEVSDAFPKAFEQYMTWHADIAHQEQKILLDTMRDRGVATVLDDSFLQNQAKPKFLYKSFGVKVLLPDDFLIFPDGKCVSVMEYGSKNNPMPPSMAVVHFNIKDLDNPEILAKKLTIPEEKLNHILDQLREAEMMYGIKTKSNKADVIRNIQKLTSDRTALAAITREKMGLYKITPSTPEMHELRNTLLQKLSTPTVVHTPEMVAALENSGSSFILGNEKELTRFSKKGSYGTTIVPVSIKEAESVGNERDRTDSELQLSDIVFRKLCLSYRSHYESIFFLQNVTEDFNAVAGYQNAERDGSPEHMAETLSNIHYLIHREDARKAEGYALALYIYHNMMVDMKASLRAAPVQITNSGIFPIHPNLRAPERAFWEKLNETLQYSGATASELERHFATALSEHMQFITNRSAAINLQEIAKSDRYAGHKIPEDAKTELSRQIKNLESNIHERVANKEERNSSGIEVINNSQKSRVRKIHSPKTFQQNMRTTGLMTMTVSYEYGTNGVGDFLNDHRQFFSDISNYIYAPLMEGTASNKNTHILADYAAGVMSLEDILDIKPEYWKAAVSITEIPSPRALFLASLKDALVHLAKEKAVAVNPDSDMHNRIEELKVSFKEAVIPDAVRQYPAIAQSYTELRKAAQELGELDSPELNDRLTTLVAAHGFANLKHMLNVTAGPLTEVENVPEIARGKLQTIKDVSTVLKQIIPIIQVEKSRYAYAKRLNDFEEQWNKYSAALSPEMKQQLFASHRDTLPASLADMRDQIPWEQLRGLSEDQREGLFPYLSGLVKSAKEQAAAATPASSKLTATIAQSTVFPDHCKLAEALHGEATKMPAMAKSRYSGIVLPSVWNEVSALRETSKKEEGLNAYSNIVFSDPVMRVLEYACTPDPSKLGDANALNKRFSNARAEIAKLKKAINDTIELAAVGDEASMTIAKSIFATPTLLVCATGDRALIDTIRTSMLHKQAGFDSSQLNEAYTRTALLKIGVEPSAVDIFYPPPPLPETKYTTTQGLVFYSRSPRYRDISKALDLAKADTDMHLLQAIGDNQNRFQCDLMFSPSYALKMTFASESGEELQCMVPLNVQSLDDAVDIKIALQSYVLNKEDIEPLRRTITAGKKTGVSKSDYIPPAAGSNDPNESTQPRIQSSGGKLFCTLAARYKKKSDKQPILIPLGIPDIDTPDNHIERQQRQEFVENYLKEMHTRREWRTKDELEQSLKQRFKVELGRPWLEANDHVGVSGFESASRLAFPTEHSTQTSFISPASIYLEPGGSNPSYMLHYSIDVKHGEQGKRETVRTRTMRLHTADQTVATARARMALEQLKEGMMIFAAENPNAEWLFLQQSQRKPYQSPLQIRSEIPGMTSNKLEATLDRISNYEDDVCLQAERQPDSGIRLSLHRTNRRNAFDMPYNADLKRHEPKLLPEAMYTKSTGGKILPMAMKIEIPEDIKNREQAFLEAVNESFSYAIGEHYNRASLGLKEGEEDIYKGNPDYRESIARDLFLHVIEEKNKEILDGRAVIVEPLPDKPARAGRKKPIHPDHIQEPNDTDKQASHGRG